MRIYSDQLSSNRGKMLFYALSHECYMQHIIMLNNNIICSIPENTRFEFKNTQILSRSIKGAELKRALDLSS